MDAYTVDTAPRAVKLPIKRARPSNGLKPMSGHNDTDPSFTPEVAKMLGAYIAAYGELPNTESIPPPDVSVELGPKPLRRLMLDVSSQDVAVLAMRTINQDIPLVAGLTLHLELGIDTEKFTFTAIAKIINIPIIGSVTIGNCSLGGSGQRCEFGYKSILHAALYIDGRTLKLDLDIVGNHSTLNIITI